MANRIALMMLALAACAPDAPGSYAIDPAMPEAQAEVIRDAVRAWCYSERAYCPVELAWGEAEGAIHWSTDYTSHGRQEGSMAFTDRYAQTIHVNAAHLVVDDLHVFWLGMAHELGHLSGLDGHGHGLAIMAAEPDPTLPLIVQ